MYQDTEPYWSKKNHWRRGHRIHVWWQTNWYCNTYKNIMKLSIQHVKLNETEDNNWTWLGWEVKSYNYFIDFTRNRMGRNCQTDEQLSVGKSIEDDCAPIARLQIFDNLDEAEDSKPPLEAGGVSLYVIVIMVIVLVSLVGTSLVISLRLASKKPTNS